MIKPITMSEVRLCAGEGKLAAHDVLAACNAVLRMRVSDKRVYPKDKAKSIPTIKYDGAGKCVLMAFADGYIMARRPGCVPFVMRVKAWMTQPTLRQRRCCREET